MRSRPPALPPAVSGARHTFQSAAGPLSYYTSVSQDAAEAVHHAPLLLIHSVNAAASAYEVRPLYEHYRGIRSLYAPDLPGFGFSDRSDRDYTPRLMTDAIHAMVAEIRRVHGPAPIDALAVSLSCEFLARAASEAPGALRSIALVSPTGFNRAEPRYGPPGSTRGMPLLRSLFTRPLWSQGFFDLLTSRPSVRYFLHKTWGSKQIDEGLLDYDCLTTRQPGARQAPYCLCPASSSAGTSAVFTSRSNCRYGCRTGCVETSSTIAASGRSKPDPTGLFASFRPGRCRTSRHWKNLCASTTRFSNALTLGVSAIRQP
jgi:pimeloyl-ACP methyl ester carboxylesterase